MTDRQLRLRLGIFAVLALVLLATLVVLFGSMPRFFERTNPYIIRFKDTPNLRAGAPVRRSGVRVGEVKDITFDEQGRVLVHVQVDKTYTVRENEEPTLIVSLIGNDASIDFVPKENDDNRTPIPPGSTIDGENPVSINKLIARASDVVPTTRETLDDIRQSMKKLSELTPVARETLEEYRKLGKSANELYPTVKDATEEYRKLAKNANDSFPAVRDALEEYRKLGHTANEQLPDLAKSLKGSSDDFGAAARESRKLVENVNVLLQTNQDKLVKAVDNLNVALERMAQLLSDTNVKNVTTLIQNAREGSDRFPSIMRNVLDITEQGQLIAKNTKDASVYFPSIAKNADDTLKRLQVTLERADATMTDLQKIMQPVGERGPAITKNLDESVEKLNRTMTDVRELMRVIGESDGTVKRLLTNPSVYNNLDQTSCMIAQMMPRLDRILKDLETFADKLARHPELIGGGGIVRPSNGLKDSEPVNPHAPSH